MRRGRAHPAEQRHQPSVGVFAPSRPGLVAALSSELEGIAGIVELDTIPYGKQARDRVFVVDPIDLRDGAAIARIRDCAATSIVYLLVGQGVLRSEWLEIVNDGRVKVIPFASSASGVSAAAGTLRQHLWGPSAEVLVRRVIQREPSLRQIENATCAVITHPWKVRRPKDLARVATTSIAELGRSVRKLGLVRVEHFILLVRMVALEVLIGPEYCMPASIARAAVGFSDPSNMRRQVARALGDTRYSHFAASKSRAG